MFEQWAAQLPLMEAADHRDDPFQVEPAIYWLQPVLLDTEAMRMTHNARLPQPILIH